MPTFQALVREAIHRGKAVRQCNILLLTRSDASSNGASLMAKEYERCSRSYLSAALHRNGGSATLGTSLHGDYNPNIRIRWGCSATPFNDS
jgi:hypothetical protein